MVDGALLYGLLSTGAGIAASAACGEVGKTAIKDAYEALRSLLSDEHGVGSLELISRANVNPNYALLIQNELSVPGVSRDPEVARLAETLRAAIAAIQVTEEAHYAVDIRTGIEAARHIRLKAIGGIRAESIRAGMDLTMENIQAPPGKS